jgi:hypothetical protein
MRITQLVKEPLDVSIRRLGMGVTSFESRPGRGRPNSLVNQELKAFVESDTCQISRDMARHFGVSHSTIFAYLKQIEKKKKLGRWVS